MILGSFSQDPYEPRIYFPGPATVLGKSGYSVRNIRQSGRTAFAVPYPGWTQHRSDICSQYPTTWTTTPKRPFSVMAKYYELCDRYFDGQRALQQHLNSLAHIFECGECDRTFGSQLSTRILTPQPPCARALWPVIPRTWYLGPAARRIRAVSSESNTTIKCTVTLFPRLAAKTYTSNGGSRGRVVSLKCTAHSDDNTGLQGKSTYTL